MVSAFISNFATEIGRVHDILIKKQASDQDAFVAKTLGPYSTTGHLLGVKVTLSPVTGNGLRAESGTRSVKSSASWPLYVK